MSCVKGFLRAATLVAAATFTTTLITACGGSSSSSPPAPTTVAVPVVVGETQAAATTTLTGAGLTLGTVSTESSATVASGVVISQVPAATTQVAPGSSVALTVSSGPPPVVSTSLSGVAASGYAVANGPGYALDAVTGTQLPFVTDAKGNYSVNIKGYTGPFLLHVLAQSAGAAPVNIYSLAAASSAGTTVNITPLSDVVVGYAAGVSGPALESACTQTQSACPALLTGILAKLNSSNSAVVNSIPASVLSAFGLTPATFNAITTAFETTHTGVDGLLDALSVIPPQTSGAPYTVSLLGATPTVLSTVPTSGTAGTQAGAPTAGSAPTSAVVAQATNLAAAQPEIQSTFFLALTNLFATSKPTVAQVQDLMTPNFFSNGLYNGATGAQVAAGISDPNGGEPVGAVFSGGSTAPYSAAPYTAAAPGPAVTYDANNCPTSVWVYLGNSGEVINLVDTIPTTNTPGVCTGGKWKWAGNGRTYQSQIYPKFASSYASIGGTPTYKTGIVFNTRANQSTANAGASAPYTYVYISGPGLTTISAPNATTGAVGLQAPGPLPAPISDNVQNGLVDIDPSTGNYLGLDPYYGGGDFLQSCQAILGGSPGYGATNANTPCFNSNVTATSDYVVTFYDQNAVQLGGAQQARFPIALAGVALPTSYFPKITSVTPASSAISASATTNVTTTWTLPPGATTDSQGLFLGASGGGTAYQIEYNVKPTAVTYTIAVPATAGIANGNSHVNIVIAGFAVGTDVNF